MRKKRKREHVENYLKSMHKGDTLFDCVYLEHNSLPNLNFDEIDISTDFLGKRIAAPIIINAMTGGSEFTKDINRDLSLLAREFNIPMAVGSQTIALCEDEECVESFKVVRDNIGQDGIVIANLNAQASIEDINRAIDMIAADAIQLHLNPAQEVVMLEGDRNFIGVLDNIHEITKSIDKPVIVKEVGFGISKDVASKLYNAGVRNIDISGYGGTNFIEIEDIRFNNIDFSDLYDWGIPTAVSLIKCRQLPSDLNLIASGGIKNSIDVVKALVLGASVAGISGELLSYLMHGGYDGAKAYLEATIYKMKVLMLLLGKKNLQELRNTEYKIIGELKELI